jgi:hypothetical protein
MNHDLACNHMATELLCFIADRSWVEARTICVLKEKFSSFEWNFMTKEGVLITKSLGEGWATSDISDKAEEGARFLLTESSEPACGLTFVMHPDGKYRIEYAYTLPDWLQETAKEQAEQSVGLEDVASLMHVEPSVFSAPALIAQADEAMLALQRKTDALSNAWGLGTEQDWSLDLNTGTVSFSFPNGKVVMAEVQVVGTLNTQDQTFLWAWDHPSIPQPLRKSALEVKALGSQFDEPAFINRQMACSELDAWKLTALATALTQADGAYRGNANGTWVYFTFHRPRLV